MPGGAAAMTDITIVADYQNLCGECPVWNPDYNTLEWTDCVGLKFFRLNWATRRHFLVKPDLAINGFRPNGRGGYVITNGDGFWLWNGADELKLVAAEADGAKCQMNDCVADARGRLLAGSCFYNPAAEFELGKLFLLDNNGKAHVLDDGFVLANGLGFSPDGKTLYFADSATRLIYAYDYDIAAGSVGNRRVFVHVPREEGLPDGLSVDAQGFIWSAQWYASSVVRYDPDGKIERRVKLPAKQVSSLTFGGPQLTDIFVTSAGQSEPMPIMPPGYDPQTGPFGGALYHFNMNIAGQSPCKADITI
jgi:sugar lactone lactonase YvrE